MCYCRDTALLKVYALWPVKHQTEGLITIHILLLVVTIVHKAGLIARYSTIYMKLMMKTPHRSVDIDPRGSWYKFPSPIYDKYVALI